MGYFVYRTAYAAISDEDWAAVLASLIATFTAMFLHIGLYLGLLITPRKGRTSYWNVAIEERALEGVG